MTNFINEIYDFIINIFNTIGNYFTANGLEELYNNFLAKDIINGDLISIGLTWQELFYILLGVIVLILCICFVFKLFSKLLGLFRVN